MLLKTILNSRYKFKSFVYEKAVLINDATGISVEVVPRSNSKAICSGCGSAAPIHQTDKVPRHFEFVPLWGIPVFFAYCMRRVHCGLCGVKVERVPWAEGKSHSTIAFKCFLASWAKSLSWSEVATRFNTNWNNVFHAVEYVVEWGLAHRDLTGILSIGIDEVAWGIGHTYLTLVYQLDSEGKRLLWIGKDRSVRSILRFFIWMGKERSAALKFICSDMWKPYLKVIKKKAINAINILDRFHIMQKINKAIDEVRSDEHRHLSRDGHDILKNARWCLLKRKENLTEKQELRLRDLLRYNLKSVRSYLLREDFQGFWQYVSATWASKFLNRWIGRVMRSKIEPMKKVAKTLKNHQKLILNWFQAKGGISTGVVEGFNNKVKVTTRKAYGYRTFRCIEIQLYHVLGNLPVPELTHRFG